MWFDNMYNNEDKNKKIIIGVLISVCIICAIAIIIFCITNNKGKFVTITSSDGKVSLQLPNNIHFRTNSATNNDFTIDLFSEQDEMYMYSTTIEKKRDIDLKQVTMDDKTSYFKDKENLRDDSGFIETKISNNKAIEYSLVYFDKDFSKDFYCNVVWVETSDYIYVFNFEVYDKNADRYKEIFNSIKNSINIL